MPLEPCPTCRRHRRVDDGACPFCRAPSPVRAALLSGVTAAALALSGCPDPGPQVAPVYGAPPDAAPVQSDTPAPDPRPAPTPAPGPTTTPSPPPQAPAYGAPPGR